MGEEDYRLVMKMKIIQLSVVFALLFLISCMSGCIGGKSVNANSSGTVITSSNLVRQPNGIYVLVPKGVPAPPKSKPVKMESVRSRPAPPKSVSAKPHPFPRVNVVPSNPPTPKKDPPKIVIPQLSTITNQSGELPIIIDNSGNEYNLTPIAEKDPKVKVDWLGLIKYYLIAGAISVLIYLGYKQYQKRVKRSAK